MKKGSKKTFVFETEIRSLNSYGFCAFESSSEFSRKAYNAILGKLRSRLNAMRNSPGYRKALSLNKGSKERSEAFLNLRLEFDLTEYAAIKLASRMKGAAGEFDSHLPSKVAQDIGKRAWQAISKKMFGKSKRVRMKRKGDFLSLRGNSNKESPQVKFDGQKAKLFFLKKEYEIVLDFCNPYHRHAMDHFGEIAYSTIVRRVIRGKTRWFVQISIHGEQYRDIEKERKHNHSIAQRFGNDYKSEVSSVDFGPSAIAVSNKNTSYEKRIVEDSLEEKIKMTRAIQRRMSRSLRINNKDAFKNGALRKGSKLQKTKNYKKLADRKKDLDRKITAHRKSIIGNVANEAIQLGSTVKLENISYVALQKLYGKSVGRSAPSSLKASLFRKAEALGGRGELINTFQTKLSQTCLCGTQRKKMLWERWHNCESCGFQAPRDTLSAFLGVFTENETVKSGGKMTIISRLNLASARLFAPGHKVIGKGLNDFSFGGHETDSSTSKVKGEPVSATREERTSSETSKEKIHSNHFLESEARKGSGKRKSVKDRESPSISRQ